MEEEFDDNSANVALLFNLHTSEIFKDNDLRPQNTWPTILENMSLEYSEILKNLKEEQKIDERDVIKCLYKKKSVDLNKINLWVHKWYGLKRPGKCMDLSELWKTKGNCFFKGKNTNHSLICYTISILNAPPNASILGIAYANRSAVFFELFKYKECVFDILQALKSLYPNNLKYKIYFRLAKCYKELGKIDECKAALLLAQEYLDFADMNKTDKLTNIETYENFGESLNNENLNIEQQNQNEDRFPIPEPAYGENKDFLYATSAVDLKTSEENGRYVVANRDIKRGDIIFSEIPYSMTFADEKFSFCFHCNLDTGYCCVPCQACAISIYCSEKCRDVAWNLYHQWECIILQTQIDKVLGIGCLALKVFLTGSHVKFNAKVDSENVYGSKPNNYASIYNLKSHINDMESDEIMSYALTAIMLTSFLSLKTDFFKQLESFNISKKAEHILVSSLLLRHICQMQCNAQTTLLNSSDMLPRVVIAICPSASMMNHSCDTNVTTDCFNNYMIVRAARDISAGEEVSNSYGHHYKTDLKKERQENLKRVYYFTCKCSACTSTDPKITKHIELFNAIKCSQCHGRVIKSDNDRQNYCFDCNQVFKWKPKQWASLISNLCDGNEYTRALSVMKKFLHQDNYKIREIYKKMSRFYKKKKCWKKYIEVEWNILRMMIRELGIENKAVIHYMIKFSSAMLNYLITLELTQSDKVSSFGLETLYVLREAKKQIEFITGPWDEMYKLVDYNIKATELLLANYSIKNKEWLKLLSNV